MNICHSSKLTLYLAEYLFSAVCIVLISALVAQLGQDNGLNALEEHQLNSVRSQCCTSQDKSMY